MQRLLDKLMFIYNYVEMARVTGQPTQQTMLEDSNASNFSGVPIGWLLVRGQMLKVMSQLLRKVLIRCSHQS